MSETSHTMKTVAAYEKAKPLRYVTFSQFLICSKTASTHFFGLKTPTHHRNHKKTGLLTVAVQYHQN
ncbi:MAG: hypothetical protein V1753_09120, partial [Pseudomonadota bacterium]